MTIKEELRFAAILPAGKATAGTFVAAGSVLGAIAASSCCILPLALFSLGVSGAWIGNLTAIAPYQPYLIAATVGLLGHGYWLVYRRSQAACAVGEACARPVSNRFVMTALVLATVLVVAAVGVNLSSPYLL